MICHGRSPDLRVGACVGPSRFPSGICRTRSPLTVAGAVVGFHHVPFSPGVARTMTSLAYNWAVCIASFGDLWVRIGRVWGWHGNRWDWVWEKMGRIARALCDKSNHWGDSGGNSEKIVGFRVFSHCDLTMFLVCLLRVWEIMGNNPACRTRLYIVFVSVSCGVFCQKSITYLPDAVSEGVRKQHMDANSHKKLLRPMLSHGIPNARDESRNSKRGDTDLDAVSKQ